MQLSIVTTLYRSAAHLREFVQRMGAAADAVTRDWELITVNDGSPDDSQRVAEELTAADPRLSVVELARNFGHHKAIMTGLELARGERVFLIDCDLEEPPEELARFTQELETHDVDVVYGVQAGTRKGQAFERASGSLFYTVVNQLSTHPIPRNVVTARLMRRDYVRALVQHRDQELFLIGLMVLTGFRQRPLSLIKLSTSPSTYSLARKLEILVNAVTSFSVRPLVFIFYLGLFMSAASGAMGVWLLVRHFFLGGTLLGWASLILSVWFMGGLSIFSLGIIGIYLSKVFMESKRRPYTTIRSLRGALAGDAEARERQRLGA